MLLAVLSVFFSQWKTYCPSSTGGSPGKATAPKIKSNAAPRAAAAAGRSKFDDGKGKNKFETMCAELIRSAVPGAAATLNDSLQPEQLLAAVRAEITLEDAGAEAAAENESMSDGGPSSQSASPLQGSACATVSSPVLLTASLSSADPPAPSDADADVQMQAADEDQAPHAPGPSSPTPSTSTEQPHLAIHTRIDKRHLSN